VVDVRRFPVVRMLADRSNITLRVVVPERGPHGAVTGRFVVLDFDRCA
jgi:hypothetical protein